MLKKVQKKIMSDLQEWQECFVFVNFLHEEITRPVGFVIMVSVLAFQLTQHEISVLLVLENYFLSCLVVAYRRKKASQSGVK